MPRSAKTCVLTLLCLTLAGRTSGSVSLGSSSEASNKLGDLQSSFGSGGADWFLRMRSKQGRFNTKIHVSQDNNKLDLQTFAN